MKKLIVLFMMLFVAGIVIIAQEPADTTGNMPVDLVTGGTLKEFLQNNMWVLILIGYSLLEAWFGQTNWIKEGSVLAFIWNWIGKIIKKQLPSVKGKFMTTDQIRSVKKGMTLIALLVLLIPLSASLSAQDGIFSQFTKKTRGTQIDLLKGEGDVMREFYVKPAASLVALNLTYDSELKKWNGSPFTAGGVGIGGQHYTEHNGVLVNDYGFNALFIINMDDPTNVGFGAAATVNALDFVNIGGGRDFTNKQWLILFGASWTF